jgi:hypothetical protein
MLRSLEDVSSQPVLDDGAVVHDCDPLADLTDHCEVVRNQNHCDLVLPPQLRNQIEDLSLYRYIEGGDRFVEDQQLRSGRERSSDGYALPFATRKLRWVSIGSGLRQTHLNEKVCDAFLTFGLTANGVSYERLGDDGADSEARVEG